MRSRIMHHNMAQHYELKYPPFFMEAQSEWAYIDYGFLLAC